MIPKEVVTVQDRTHQTQQKDNKQDKRASMQPQGPTKIRNKH